MLLLLASSVAGCSLGDASVPFVDSYVSEFVVPDGSDYDSVVSC